MVKDQNGVPVKELEPVMGAYAHFVAFNEEGTEVLHVHPLGEEPDSKDDRGGPVMEFHALFNEPGYYRFYAQFLIDGKDRFAPFGLRIDPAPPSDGAESPAQGPKPQSRATSRPTTR